jgi:hypothetical protein
VRPGVLHDVGREGEPLLPRGLCAHPRLGVLAGPAAITQHPLELHLGGRVDHDDGIEVAATTVLGEQRDVVDDDAVLG